MRWLLALLLLLPVASASSGVVVLVHHPDDGIDPLGFTYQGGLDPFAWRHGHHGRFADGFDYPAVVIDGRVPYEGLPEGEDAVAATQAVYQGAVTMRQGVETPVHLEIASTLDAVWRANLTIRSEIEVPAGLRWWSAIVEDPVHYEPPAGLTNGVFDHPFTVRSITDHGPLDLRQISHHNWTLDVDPAWQADQLHVAVWIQQDGSDGRFKPHEVVQAVMHPLTGAPTVQTERGVLVEAYSATWCKPCLIGDRALEGLAADNGLQPARAPEAGPRYFQAPAQPGLVAVLVAGGFAFFALIRLPGGRP